MAVVNLRNYTVLEDDYSTRYLQFLVELDAPATAATTIYYYTQDGTAGEAVDYWSNYDTLTFGAGEQSKIIQISVRGDTLVEGNESMKLVVLAGANATLAGGAAALVATGTILDDDDGVSDSPGGPGSYAQQLIGPVSASATFPTLSVRDVSIFEDSNYSSQNARFLVTLDRPATADVTFKYYFQDGTASTASGDYGEDYGTVTIKAGQQSTYISANVRDDNVIEGNETFRVVISEVQNAVLTGKAPALSATATIIDDDNGAPTLAGGIGAFGSAIETQASASATVPTISVHDVSLYEGNAYSSERARFLVTLDKAATADVTFSYYFEDGTASDAHGDYDTDYGTVTIKAGQQSTWISANVFGDTAIEGSENFGLVLLNARNAVFAGKAAALRATGTIIDDDNGIQPESGGIGGFGTAIAVKPAVSDVLPTVSVHDVAVYEGNAYGSTTARFLVTLDKPATAAVKLSYAFQDGSASGASGDYYDTYGTLNIEAGQQSAWISTTVYGDNAIEGNQTFNLVLSALTGAKFADDAPALVATGTIIDDDNGAPTLTGGIKDFASGVSAPDASGSLPAVRVVSTSVNEGDSYDSSTAYIHFLLSAPATSDITFTYTTQDGTAAADADYYGNSYPYTFTISAGETSSWLSYTVRGDNAIEGDESFSALFYNIQGATFEGGRTSATANVLIRDNDGTGTAGSAQTGPNFVRVSSFYGTAGADTLIGTDGPDLLDGRGGVDVLLGGAGNDTYIIDNLDKITEGINEGQDTVKASFSYTLGANLENLLLLGPGSINGTGNAAANTIVGNAAANSLNGGLGNDILSGGGGKDVLNGGAGKDKLTGGAGDDKFVFASATDTGLGNSRDTITDFSTSGTAERIDLSAFSGTFVFRGTAAFTTAAKEVGFKFVGADTLVRIDLDGDAASEMEIMLTGHKVLSANDFYL